MNRFRLAAAKVAVCIGYRLIHNAVKLMPHSPRKIYMEGRLAQARERVIPLFSRH